MKYTESISSHTIDIRDQLHRLALKAIAPEIADQILKIGNLKIIVRSRQQEGKVFPKVTLTALHNGQEIPVTNPVHDPCLTFTASIPDLPLHTDEFRANDDLPPIYESLTWPENARQIRWLADNHPRAIRFLMGLIEDGEITRETAEKRFQNLRKMARDCNLPDLELIECINTWATVIKNPDELLDKVIESIGKADTTDH